MAKKISDLTEDSTPASGDFVATVDVSAGASKKVALSNIIPAGTVTPEKLLSGTGTSWAYQSWSPTWTNLTVGNGTGIYRYVRIGKNVKGYLILKFGSTTSISGTVYFTLPVACSSNELLTETSAFVQIGVTRAYDNGTAAYSGPLLMGNNETTKVLPTMYNASATYLYDTAITSTVPMTWTTNDQLTCTFDYEAA